MWVGFVNDVRQKSNKKSIEKKVWKKKNENICKKSFLDREVLNNKKKYSPVFSNCEIPTKSKKNTKNGNWRKKFNAILNLKLIGLKHCNKYRVGAK